MPKPDRTLWKPRRRIEQSFANEMIDLMGRQFFPHLGLVKMRNPR
jgi:hypothetical protein